MIGGALQSQIKDDTKGGPPVWREPSEVTFRLGPAAESTVPSGSKFGFLGPAGSKIWMIPQVQRPGVLWAGWNTETITAADVSGEVAWRLDAVEGPGQVAVFQTGAFGQPDVIFNSGDGLPDTRTIPLGTHAHGNWSFSAEGEYRLTFTMSAELAGGGGPTADTETLAVRVQGSPGGSGPGGGGGGAGGGGGGGGGSGGGAQPALRLSAPNLRGRQLALTVKLARPGRLSIAVRRAGRLVARTPARQLGARQRRLRFRLAERLAAGRYRLVVEARIGSSIVRKAVTVRARPRG